MAYEYDRFEREDGGGSFLMGLLAGTVLGAGLGMLFAPKAGSDLRNQLNDQAGKLKATANDTYQQATDKVSPIVDRGKDAYDRARSSVSSMSGGSSGSGASGTTGSASSTGTSGGTGTGSTSGSGFSTPGTSGNRI
jgi:gas vesicle protein